MNILEISRSGNISKPNCFNLKLTITIPNPLRRQREYCNFWQSPKSWYHTLGSSQEKLMGFGYLVCLDSFLYLFTILPLRILIALYFFVHWVFGYSSKLSECHKADLLKGLLIICSSTLLQNVDASRLYHSIRGQAIIKLYVIFNALEICDKLCSAFGHDIMDSLFAPIDSKSATYRRFNRLARFMVTTAYISAHSLVLFYQVTSLNVAINSYNNALLTLLISNQFVEIKGSVFKKFEKGNLFQLSCADIVERFQLSIFLLIVTVRNCLEILGNEALSDISNYLLYYFLAIKETIISADLFSVSIWMWNISSNTQLLLASNEFKMLQIILGPCLIVMGTEVAVDWVKHAFIIKFNNLSPSAYRRFQESLCRDMLGVKQLAESGTENPTRVGVGADRSPLVAKRVGFVSIPLACVVIRVFIQILQIIGIVPEALFEQSKSASWEDGYLVEDENIGSWKLPYKLNMWIQSKRDSMEQAGFSGSSFFIASRQYSWILPLYLWYS